MMNANNSPKPSRKGVRNFLGATAIAASLTFGGTALIPAITHAQTATTAPTTSQTSPTTNTGNGQTNTNPQNRPPMPGGPGGKGGPGGRGGPGDGLGGVISSISGNTINIKHDSAVNIIATVNSSTVYKEAGQTISLSSLKAGETVQLRETRNSDGTASVTEVDVVMAHSGGTISSISGNTMTLTTPNNSSVKVNLSSSTTYTDLGKAISLSSLKAGEKVEVSGQTNSDNSLNATVVNIQHDRLGGTVTAVNGNNITVQVGGPGGRGPKPDTSSTTNSSTPATTTKTIVVSSSTTYDEAGQSAQLSSIAVGDHIKAQGTLSSDGNSLNALQVSVQLPDYHGQVTSVSGNTITLQDRSGTHQIEVNSSTKYLNGTASAALSDVKTGSNLSAQGSIDSSGKMTATQIQLGQPQPPMGK